MLRILVVVLALLNVALLGWQLGWLDAVLGTSAEIASEPDRMSLQVNPGAVRVLTPQEASAAMIQAATAAAAARGASAREAADAAVCLEAGPYSAVAAAPVERVLAQLPAGSWERVPLEPPGNFMAYVGRFGDREAMQFMLEELQSFGFTVDEVRNMPELEPGLSVGRYERREDAEAVVEDLTRRGVLIARIVPRGTVATPFMLRMGRVDAVLRERLAALRPATVAAAFYPCAAP
jgi:hypothetical protein